MTARRRFAVAGLAAGLVLSASPARAASTADPEEVTIPTPDGVRLAGVFYPSNQGTKAPCVLLLHDLGRAADSKGLHHLAGRPQKDGCAVLRFDFGGHGRSKEVRPEFWADPSNRQLVKGYRASRPPEDVAFADFRPAYLPALVRDVAAAKRFLDERNDAGECNSSQTFLVGSGGGAAVGSLWLGWEMGRVRGFGEYQARLADRPEGADVAGAAGWTSAAGRGRTGWPAGPSTPGSSTPRRGRT